MWLKVTKHFVAITSLGLPLILLTIALTSLPTARGLSDIPQNITCKDQSDCQAINGSVCEGSICACPKEKPVFVNVTINATVSDGYCLECWNVTGTNCSYSQQCDYDHGLCTNGVCGCERRYTADEGACQPIKKSDVIPIAVGAALAGTVLLTLAAYLWMSRKKK